MPLWPGHGARGVKHAVLTDRVSIIPNYNGDNNWESKVITDDEMLQLALQDLTELFGLDVSMLILGMPMFPTNPQISNLFASSGSFL